MYNILSSVYVAEKYESIPTKESWSATKNSMIFMTGNRVVVTRGTEPQVFGTVVLKREFKKNHPGTKRFHKQLPLKMDDGTYRLVPIGIACYMKED